jgi:NMT1/THI5 like
LLKNWPVCRPLFRFQGKLAKIASTTPGWLRRSWASAAQKCGIVSMQQETDMDFIRQGRAAAAFGAGLALMVVALCGSASAETRLKMVLNWKYQGPQGFFFVAQDKGYFKEEGLDVIIDQGDGSATPIPKVASGTYDVGFGDINALIDFASKRPEGFRRQDARRRRQ